MRDKLSAFTRSIIKCKVGVSIWMLNMWMEWLLLILTKWKFDICTVIRVPFVILICHRSFPWQQLFSDWMIHGQLLLGDLGLEQGVYFLGASRPNPDSHHLWRWRLQMRHIWRYDNVSKEWVAGDYTKSFLLITIFKAFPSSIDAANLLTQSTFVSKMSIATS